MVMDAMLYFSFATVDEPPHCAIACMTVTQAQTL
jgi:hypothetical protein